MGTSPNKPGHCCHRTGAGFPHNMPEPQPHRAPPALVFWSREGLAKGSVHPTSVDLGCKAGKADGQAWAEKAGVGELPTRSSAPQNHLVGVKKPQVAGLQARPLTKGAVGIQGQLWADEADNGEGRCC